MTFAWVRPLRLPLRGAKLLTRRMLTYWWLRRAGVRCLGVVSLIGRPYLRRCSGSEIELGPHVSLVSSISGNQLEARGPCILQTINPKSSIVIGESSGLTSATISAAVRVEIGRRVLLGSGVLITDSDHHPVDIYPFSARRSASRPRAWSEDAVVIEDDVFVGARSVILKGVRIGAGTVVGAGSVVVRDLPPGVVAGGNPCRVIRDLVAEK